MSRPRGSGYEALPAHDELDEELEEGLTPGNDLSASVQSNGSNPGPSNSRRGGRSRSLSTTLSIDASALDAKLTQWRRAIKRKFAKKHSGSYVPPFTAGVVLSPTDWLCVHARTDS